MGGNKAGYIDKLVYYAPGASNKENKNEKSPTERHVVEPTI